jgi:hypothetical protein
MKYCGTTWSNRVFWTLDGECCELQPEIFPKTLWKLSNRHFQLFSGDFVWGGSFGRSPKELPVEYQIDLFFMNISVEMA